MKSLEELKAIRERMEGIVGFRSEDSSMTKVIVSMDTCGIAHGARPVLTTLSDAVQEKKLSRIAVIQSGCMGLCQCEPTIAIEEPGQEKVIYVNMTPEKALEVLEHHLIGGQILSKYTLNGSQE